MHAGRETLPRHRCRVAGNAHYMGAACVTLEADDPLAEGFLLG